jgi:hypothetical protein
MRSVWVALHPKGDETRILVTAGPNDTLLKARLSPTVQHPRAVPTLLEALALWEGAPVRAVVAVDGPGASSATSLCLDSFADFTGGPLYELQFVPWARVCRMRDLLRGMGDFRDLRQLLLFEGPR